MNEVFLRVNEVGRAKELVKLEFYNRSEAEQGYLLRENFFQRLLVFSSKFDFLGAHDCEFGHF